MVINRTTGNLSTAMWVAIVLSVIGALNWGLVGLFEYNLVAAIFGTLSVLSRLIYVVVGLAGLFLIYGASQFRREARGTTVHEPVPRAT